MENNKFHILIVDDDDRIRNLLKDYLSDNNYIVSTAENAEQAKKRITYLKFDIIILDVMMPGQSGYDLTRELKESKNIPIILLTAKGEVENRIHGLELGADDYLGKPFDPKELLLRVKNIIKLGVDLIVVDTAHGHSQKVADIIMKINKIKTKKRFAWIHKFVKHDEMLSTFNCGVGFCVIVSQKNVKKVLKYSKKSKPYIIGKIVKNKKSRVLLNGKIKF